MLDHIFEAEDESQQWPEFHAAAKTIVKQPVATYVEKVYEEGDFSTLGIST